MSLEAAGWPRLGCESWSGSIVRSSAVPTEPLRVDAVSGLDRPLGDRNAVHCEPQEREHLARHRHNVDQEVLKANDEWLDVVRCEPRSPGGVVLGDLAR